MYIEAIIERLNNPNLQQTTNQGRIVLDGTIGEYLEHYDNHFLDLWLCTAKGDYLNVLGEVYGVIRQENETDTSYRNRIYSDIKIIDSAANFSDVGVRLWVYNSGVENGLEYLTSENLALKDVSNSPVYLAHSDNDTADYIAKKFILGDIRWF